MTLKGFHSLREIYRGAGSTVFRAVRERDQSTVILKCGAGELPTTSRNSRLRHEYEIGISLKDIPGVIKYLDLLDSEIGFVIVLEDIDGMPLREFFQTFQPHITTVIETTLQIAQVLAAIHDRGVIHKDLNPSNIVVDGTGNNLRLIDFELAINLPRETQQIKPPELIEGTLAYISPEQTGRMNCPVDLRTDLYSLGVMFYESLAGQLPFSAEDKNELIHRHIALVPEPPLVASSEYERCVSAVVLKLLAKAPENRYCSAYGLVADLNFLLSNSNDASALADFSPGRHDQSHLLLIPSKLYGRETETQTLFDTYAQVASGQTALVLVNGGAGVGKSSLIQELHKPLSAGRGFFLSGKFDQFGRSVPYSAFLTAFIPLFRRLISEPDDRVQTWKSLVLEMANSAISALFEVLPEIAWLVGEQPPAPVLEPQEAHNRFLHLMEGLVRVFASPEHPLVLFIDDLQWADSASLDLLERLLSEQALRGLLILGAYRDQEVDDAHPLRLLLRRLNTELFVFQQISLSPLTASPLIHLVADSLSLTPEDVQSLTSILFEKTQGNPFFFTQMLRHLFEQRLLRYSPEEQKWTWDIPAIKRLEVAENVVDYLVAKLKKLPPETAQILAIASCIGPNFALNAVSSARGLSAEELLSWLPPALHEELIYPFDDGYRFMHDRIQQAAGHLLSDLEKAMVHWRLGNYWLQEAHSPKQFNENLFHIVDHLNVGIAVLETSDTDTEQRVALAGYNLQAGQKAKSSGAFREAKVYLELGRAILEPFDPWQTYYQNRLRLQLDLAECLSFLGDNSGALGLYQEALSKAMTRQDRALVHENLIHFYTNLGQFQEAYQVSRQALKPFAVSLPPGFLPPVFIKDLVTCKILWGKRRAEDLLQLPECTNEERATAMRLVAAVLKACYQIRPELCVANAFKLINMALKFGLIRDLPVAFMAAGGIFLGSIIGKHQVGWDFGQLALAVIEKYQNEKQKPEVNFIYGYFVHFWKKSAADAERYFHTAYDSAQQTGDHFHLSCAACTLVESAWIRGENFDELTSLAQAYQTLLKKIDRHEASGAIQAVTQAIANLQGKTQSPLRWDSEEFAESAYKTQIAQYDLRHFSHFYFINKMQTLYLWQEYAEAWRICEESRSYLKYSVGMLHTTEHYFYQGLIAAVHPQFSLARKKAIVHSVVKRFTAWASENPENFEHKRYLLAAEEARLKRKKQKALFLYQAAIQAAQQQKSYQNKALAEERCALFLLNDGHTDLASRLLRSAKAGYEYWGATAKADALVEAFPAFDLQLSLQESSLTTSRRKTKRHSLSTDHNLDLDLGSILKATQAISQEIQYDGLLGKLIGIILESAGAQKGFILTPASNTFKIEVRGELGQPPQILHTEANTTQEISEAVLRYVRMTKETFILDQTTKFLPFTDQSTALASTKSLLCTPVLHQGQVIALIYLVNNLSDGAFTPASLAVLTMLSAQAAISIENARNYEQMEKKVAVRTKDLKIAQETSNRLLLNILPISIADELKQFGKVVPRIHKNATVLFTDFSNFTTLASRMTPLELINTLGQYFSTFDEICSRYGLEKLKTIGDAYMAVCGLPLDNPTHAVSSCLAALEMSAYVQAQQNEDRPWSIRIGLHSGEVVAGVVGTNKFAYDIWGDTVNIASRMESAGSPGRVNVSGVLWEQVSRYFEAEARGLIAAKNRGDLPMYYLDRVRAEYSADASGVLASHDFLSQLKRWKESGVQP
ncbi:MAG: AAA family ATPase [Spirochaetales bacterium]|nr:AAA family ATPase [Spirochaetales bacterium]